MRVVGVTIAIALLAGCNGSDDTGPLSVPPTTSTPTTAITTTTQPSTPAPTTAVPTTPPPTTAPIDPVEAAKAAVAARYEEFSATANECAAAKTDCDLPAVLGAFASSDADLYLLYEGRWRARIENNWSVENLDQISRTVSSVQVDGDFALLVGCVVDGASIVDATGVVVDDGVGYREEETTWENTDSGWRLVGGTTYDATANPQSSSCQF